MKRKPNNGAGPEPREAAGAADPGGAGEGNAGGTSGQSVPKSKFRQKSNQEKAAASKLRMEKRGEKLDRAKEKLAKQKPPKKPGPVRRVGRVASGSAHSFVHGKIYENEHENVGIEGAHRSELVGESALRHGSRFVKRKIREHPAKAVQKAESRYIKATADYHFHTAAQEHPELSGTQAITGSGLRPACAGDAVLFFFPCYAGKQHHRRGGGQHLPLRGRGSAGGRSRLL